MKPKLILLLVNMALLAAWMGNHAAHVLARRPLESPSRLRPGRRSPARHSPVRVAAGPCLDWTRMRRLRSHCSRRRVSSRSAAVGPSDDPETAGAPGDGKTLEQLWRAPGDDVAVIAGTQSHEPGDVRVSFLVVDSQGRVSLLPTARVWVSRALDAAPFLESTAQLERIGVPGGAEADATHIYVAHLRLPEPGTYWLLAEPESGKPVQALGNVVVSGRRQYAEPGRSCASLRDADAGIGR